MAKRVDLRSDTVTQPTQAMREAMASAVVGDDGSGEDPTINELEKRYAQIVGKDAAVFVPSGVMANQIAIRINTKPGDVIVSGRDQHVVSFELGAAALIAHADLARLHAGLAERLLDRREADLLELPARVRHADARRRHRQAFFWGFLGGGCV